MKNLSTRELVLVALFAALTAVLSFVTISLPFSTVPITGQTLGVMLAGGLLGSKLGMLSQLVYLIIGLVGVPVFAGGTAGIGVFLGPSGGFLLGFPLGAFVIGKISEIKKGDNLLLIVSAQIIGGIIAIYIPGVIQLSRFVDGQLLGAITTSFLFIPGDIFKVIIATAAIKAFKSRGIENLLKFGVQKNQS